MWFWIGVATLLAYFVSAELCDADWKEKKCPLYCTGVLLGKCCSRSGQSASMQIVGSPYHARAISSRTEWYTNCTGGVIETPVYQRPCHSEYCGGFRALFESGIGALDDAEEFKQFDSYMTQATDLPQLAPFVETLDSRISNSPELNWNDLFSHVKKSNAVAGEQKALPFDFDFINILFREDLIAAYSDQVNKPAPTTFEELADFVEFWHGKDLNGDGEPDVGICSLNGAGPGGPQAMLMAIAASKLQYLGSTQGFFFDVNSKNADPLIDNSAFREALNLTRRMWLHSLDDQPGGWVELHEDNWLNGRYDVVISLLLLPDVALVVVTV